MLAFYAYSCLTFRYTWVNPSDILESCIVESDVGTCPETRFPLSGSSGGSQEGVKRSIGGPAIRRWGGVASHVGAVFRAMPRALPTPFRGMPRALPSPFRDMPRCRPVDAEPGLEEPDPEPAPCLKPSAGPSADPEPNPEKPGPEPASVPSHFGAEY